MGYGVGGVGATCGGFSSIGIVLVLFILLVIILRGVFF